MLHVREDVREPGTVTWSQVRPLFRRGEEKQ